MLNRLGRAKWPLIVVFTLGVLALASYITTAIYWDGGFPAGEFHVLVVDESGTPLPGVSLRVLRPATGQPAGDYPLQENTQPGGMVSGEDGVIICHQWWNGLQFGGFCWDLFWVIPIGRHGAPQYKFEFSKDGFQNRVLTADEFFDLGGQTYDSAPKVTTRSQYGDGKEVKAAIWKLKVALNRNK